MRLSHAPWKEMRQLIHIKVVRIPSKDCVKETTFGMSGFRVCGRFWVWGLVLYNGDSMIRSVWESSETVGGSSG